MAHVQTRVVVWKAASQTSLQGSEFVQPKTFHDSKNYLLVSTVHGILTPGEKIAFTARPKFKATLMQVIVVCDNLKDIFQQQSVKI